MKFILFLKKNWQIFLLAVGAVLGVLFFKRKNANFSDDYNKIKEVHHEELKKIEQALAEEKQQNQANEELLKKTIEQIQSEYEEKKIAFDQKKREQVENIVAQHGHDPDTLAKMLSEVSGIRIKL